MMNPSNIIFVVLMTVLVMVHSATNPCIISNQGDGVYYLNALATKNGYTAQGDDGSTYTVNFCQNIASPCSGQTGMATQVNSGNCYTIAYPVSQANAVTASILDPSNPHSGIRLNYDNAKSADGYLRKTRVNLNCDPKAGIADGFRFVEEKKVAGSSEYTFEVTSKCACPNACKGTGPSGGRKCLLGCGYGIGGLLLTLSLVALILYFVIGIIVCKFVLKKEGREIIPNVHFWFDIPFLLKDGVMIFVDLFRKVTKKGEYSEV